MILAMLSALLYIPLIIMIFLFVVYIDYGILNEYLTGNLYKRRSIFLFVLYK